MRSRLECGAGRTFGPEASGRRADGSRGGRRVSTRGAGAPRKTRPRPVSAGVLQGDRIVQERRGNQGNQGGIRGNQDWGPKGGRRVGCPAAPAVTASTKEEFGLVAVSCALGTMSSVAVAAAGHFRGLRAPGWRYRADWRRSVRHSAGAFRFVADAPVSLRPFGPSPWPGGRCREFIARAHLRKGEPEGGQERRGNGTPHVHRIREGTREVPLPPETCRAARGGCLRSALPCPFRWPMPGGGGAAATGGSRRPGGSG